jgi:hypothetical protein
MNRRLFLGAMTGAAAAQVIDPERLLWVPGKKKIFIPPAPQATLLPVTLGPGDEIMLRFMNGHWRIIRNLSKTLVKVIDVWGTAEAAPFVKIPHVEVPWSKNLGWHRIPIS